MKGIVSQLANCLNSLEYLTPEKFDDEEHKRNWEESIKEYHQAINHPVVYLLTISHRHGVDTTVHETQTSADTALDRYCRDWWHEISDQPYPEDGTGIDAYFFATMDGESYDITGTPIQS